MKTLRVVAWSLVLVAVTSTLPIAVAASPDTTTTRMQRVSMFGASIELPVGPGWNQRWVQPWDAGLTVERSPEGAHSFFGSISAERTETGVESLDQVKAMAGQLASPDKRQRLISDSVWVAPEVAPLAVRYAFLLEDLGVPGYKGRPCPLSIRGLLAIHPQQPHLIIHAFFSERTAPAQAPELDSLAAHALNSLRMTVRDSTHVQWLPLSGDPDAITFSHGSYWVSVWHHSEGKSTASVVRVDSSLTRIEATIPIPYDVMDLVATEAALWVSGSDGGERGRLSRIDPLTNRLTATLNVGKGALRVCDAFGYLWCHSAKDGKLFRIDPVSSAILEWRGQTPGDAGTIVPAGGMLWSPMGSRNRLAIWDPSRPEAAAEWVTTPFQANELVAASGSVWVACGVEPWVLRYDQATRTLQQKIAIRSSWHSGLTTDGNRICLGDYDDGTVLQIDATTGAVTPLPWPPAGRVGRLLAHNGAVLVTDRLGYGLARFVPR